MKKNIILSITLIILTMVLVLFMNVGINKNILKYILWAIHLSFIITIILKGKAIRAKRKIILIFTIIVFGIFFGATPNPMESIVKLFKMFNKMGGDPQILWPSFIIFTLFSIVGSKLICSWGCQLGALQESIFNIPIYKKKYNFKIPFIISLVIRMLVFTAFLTLLFGFAYGMVYNVKKFVIPHHVNYFKVFNFRELAVIAFYTLPILIIASLFIYRPFCHYICPFGLYSWLLQNISIKKIKINNSKCIECRKCISACPTEVMGKIYETKNRYLLPDCWSCGLCIDSCPVDAVEYE
ncbi:4Fe-4S binding protein [bacterium]